MRFLIIVVSVLTMAGSGLGQDIVQDSAEVEYVPLDSLDAGIDLALRALKMNRSDLTFRGDYLEPDVFRLGSIDDLMNSPFGVINHAANFIDKSEYLNFGDKSFTKTDSLLYSDLMESIMLDSIGGEGLEEVKKYNEFVIQSLQLIYANLEKNKFDKERMKLIDVSMPMIDSIIEGFTIILEEDEDDEKLSVEELDSLSVIEEDWAFVVKGLAENFKGCCGKLDFQHLLITHLSSKKNNIHKSIIDSGDAKIQTPYGQIIIGDTTDNHYEGDLFIVIDPGGNDTYNIEFEGTGHHTYIIDYGGDDTYNMPKNRVSPYFFGSNMIIDYDGDDLYNAGSWTLGAGLFGVGVLWDMKGNDRYYGDTFSMGAGCFGVGILRDDEGNDSYHAALFSQGFGFVDGVGVLIDNSGNDNYFAGGKYKDFIRYEDHYLSLSQGFGYGLRPKMSGGIGMLIDKSGKDVYVSDIFGQGASYWYSLGMLADGGGNDQYLSFQYAQGNGTHMSLGILYDVAGNDVYSAKGVSQGCGHDRAAGFLIDLDGDDNYNATDLCQGAGSANGFGMIADIRGKDVYIVRSDKNTQGYGNPRRDYGSIGIFLDLAGEDGYSGGLGHDNHWWTYSKWGVGIDK